MQGIFYTLMLSTSAKLGGLNMFNQKEYKC